MSNIYNWLFVISKTTRFAYFNSLLITLLFLLFSGSINGQIYVNQFVGSTGTCPTQGNTPAVATNATGAAMSRSTVICTSTAEVFNSTTLNNTAAVVNTSYIEFSVTANAGYKLDVTSLSFFRRGSSSAPNQLEVRYSTDGFATSSTSWGAAPNTPTAAAVATWDFADFSVANPTTLTFRFYPYGTQRCDGAATPAAAATGTFRVDDVTLNGVVSAASTLSVPSSGAGSLAAFGNVCKNNTAGPNSFTITGTALTTANITVGALSGFTFSTTAGGTYTNSLSLSQPGGSFSQAIFVKFLPSTTGSYSGNIAIGGGGTVSSINVAASGSGVNTPPTLTSGSVSGITSAGATIAGVISSVGCNPITADYGIEWSTTSGFANGAGTGTIIATNLSGGNFSVPFTGSAGTTYYFHTFANNDAINNRGYGAENSFTLLSTTPTLSVPASGAGSLLPFGNVCINTNTINSFNLTGSVLDGSNVTIGPLTGYTFATSSGGTYSSTLTLTTSGTDYSYSGGTLSGCTIYVKFTPTLVQSYNGNIAVSGGGATAINVGATGSGIDTKPSVTTGSALFVGTTTTTLPGSITDEGCSSILSYGIEYSTSIGFMPGTGTPVAATNLSGGFFSVDLSSLSLGTNYYYRAYAQNNGGTTYGSELNFLTFSLPTKLVIISASPASPIAGSPFSLTVQAQDASNNPVDVTADTDIQLALTSGGGSFIQPNDPSPIAGTISNGNNTITISDLSYDLTGTAGFSATAISGMVSLGTSGTLPIMPLTFVAYTGPTTFIWNNDGFSRWALASNWWTTQIPGTSGNVANADLAVYQFPDVSGHGGGVLNTGIGGVGINMNDFTGEQMSVGGIYFNETYNYSGFNNIVMLGNSSGGVSGNVYFRGTSLNNVGGIAGNNFTNLMVANYMTNATTKTLQLQNKIGSNTAFNMTYNIAASGSFVAGAGRAININALLAGASANTLTFTGGGDFSLKPLNASDVQVSNTFAGPMVVSNGTLTVNNTGAFSNNVITLGGGTNWGKLVLNGNSVTIGGLSISGSAGTSNIVENNNAAAATITVNNTAGYTFAGAFNNGAAGGGLSITKSGAGSLNLTGQSAYTGTTTVNAGTLQLSRSGGSTIPATNNVTISGGILQISSNQTINNLTINSGALIVDATATLTITGIYNGAGAYTLNNQGTIVLAGSTAQTFPGVSATPTNMVNVTISNTALPTAVTLNRSLNITGTLLITSAVGTSIVNAGTTTLNGTGNLTMQGGNLTLARNAVTLPELAGTYTLTGGTVTLAGTGTGANAQTIRAVNYFNLASSSTGDRILASSGTIGVRNTFIPGGNTYTTTGSTIDFNKAGSTQDVPTFTYNNITVSNTGSKLLAGNITVIDALKVATNTTFDLNELVVFLKSDASKTARVAAVDGTVIYGATTGAGIFEVQRYVPARRAWRLMAVPLNATGIPTVSGMWQDGQQATTIPPPAYTANSGTLITFNTANPNGYDKGTTANPSLKYFNNSGSWLAPTGTNIAANTYPGYMLFVRGDRNFVISTAAVPAQITTLRPRGRINIGTQPVSSASAGFRVVSNPFPSAIDFKQITGRTGMGDIYYLWDPKIGSQGAFVTFSRSGAVYLQTLTAGGAYSGSLPNDGTIESGAAFMVNYTSAGGGGFDIPEAAKISGSSNTPFGLRPGAAGANKIKLLSANLLTGDGNGSKMALDGVVINYDQQNSNKVDQDDAVKLTTFNENISIVSDNKLISIEKRKALHNKDTVFIKLSQVRFRNYTLELVADNIAENNLNGFIEDTYLKSKTPLKMNGSTFYDFSITNDAGSYAKDRFRIVFKKPVSFTSIKAQPQNSNIAVNWNVEEENGITGYEVERSLDKENFISIGSLPIDVTKYQPAYNLIDMNVTPGVYYYRIKAVGTGEEAYSDVAEVAVINSREPMLVFPNPVTNNTINVQFNRQPQGLYGIKLLNSDGREIAVKLVNHAGGTATQVINPGRKLPAGIYQLKINGPGKATFNLKAVVQQK